MALCNDPSLRYLNNLGYNVVRLPKTGINPLNIIGIDKHNDPINLGDLSKIWNSSISPPKPKSNGKAANIIGQRTNRLKLSLGIKLLEDIVGCFGASVPTLGTQFQSSNRLQFIFEEVVVNSIDLFDIGKYLLDGDLQLGNPVADKFFLEEKCKTYIIYEVLKSNSISVIAFDKNDTEVKLAIPSIQSAIGGNLEVSVANEKGTAIKFKGNSLLTFGFKIIEIKYAGDNWKITDTTPNDDVFLGDKNDGDISEFVLINQNTRIDI
jgi:hypothetical protein